MFLVLTVYDVLSIYSAYAVDKAAFLFFSYCVNMTAKPKRGWRDENVKYDFKEIIGKDLHTAHRTSCDSILEKSL